MCSDLFSLLFVGLLVFLIWFCFFGSSGNDNYSDNSNELREWKEENLDKVWGDAPAIAMGNFYIATSRALSNCLHNATNPQGQSTPAQSLAGCFPNATTKADAQALADCVHDSTDTQGQETQLQVLYHCLHTLGH